MRYDSAGAWAGKHDFPFASLAKKLGKIPCVVSITIISITIRCVSPVPQWAYQFDHPQESNLLPILIDTLNMDRVTNAWVCQVGKLYS